MGKVCYRLVVDVPEVQPFEEALTSELTQADPDRRSGTRALSAGTTYHRGDFSTGAAA